MKKFLLFTVFLLLIQTSFAQTKIDVYSTGSSDVERGRIDGWLMQLQKENESKGLIVIYSGENNERLSNILRHLEGIKLFITSRTEKALSERISFKVDDGKEYLQKELWIYPKDVAFPKIVTKTLNLDNLGSKYLYTTACVGCEPTVPLLSPDFEGFETYADLLKKYPDYTSEIIVYPAAYEKSERKFAYKYALEYAADCRNLLTEKYKIDDRRIFIRVAKIAGKDDVTKAKIFIVPKTVR